MNHYTYLLQSKENDMMYIGVRSCAVSPEVDNYWGSSKHLPKNVSEVCDKFILGRFESRKDALQDEIRRHRINDVAVSKLFWNRAKQTSTGYDTTGTTLSDEHKAKASASLKGRVFTEEHRARIGKANLGRVTSEYCIAQVKLANTGKRHTEEAKLNMSQSKIGKKHSAETKQKIGKANLGNKHTEESKKKLSNALKGNTNFAGKKHTEETKLKMSNSRKALEKITCPHCDVVSLKSLMVRWHFDNCKNKGVSDEHIK
jgi:hypothetical protein